MYDGPQVAQNTLPQVSLQPAQAARVQDVAGRQAEQMGQAMQRTGGALGSIAQDMEREANQLIVNDGLDRVKNAALDLTYDPQNGFANLKGAQALYRPDDKSLEDEYGEKLQQVISSVSSGLKNDAQRQAFAMNANDILTSFRGQAMRHTSQEYATYGVSNAQGMQSTAMRDISLNWNDPGAVMSAVKRIQAATYTEMRLGGKSPEWQQARARDLTSTAHKTAILSALQANNAGYADAYLRKFSGEMNADDILAVRKPIMDDVALHNGLAVATDAIGSTPLRVGDADRAFNIAVNTESGGKQFDADGNPLTSSAGAVGIAQVMPSTGPEAARLADLPWDEERYRTDPEYNRALGRAYFGQQVKDFGGDLAKAYAAYNAGPRWVKEAQDRAAKAAPGSQEADWFWQLNNDKRTDANRQQTQRYVTTNMQAYASGAGQPARPTLADAEAKARSDPRVANNPQALKIAITEVGRQYKVQSEALQQQDDAAVADALRALEQNGGRFSELPISTRAAIPPDKLTTVMSAADRFARGDDTTSLWLYNKLTNEPDYLAGLSDDQFYALRTSLSASDFKHFSGERAKVRGAAPGGTGPGDLNSTAIKTGVDSRLRMMGMDPTPKDESNDAARVGAIRKFIDGYMLAAQRETGKKFTDAEVEQQLDALFMKSATVHGFFSNSSAPILSMKAGDIDGRTKDGIRAAFKRVGIDDPTDAMILNAFWNMQTTTRREAAK
ncbi:transglycosylase SLT domain-containing protein [Castellaniella sp.]|uniref:transglycosylase SLT domain-containing protein n=1 Tax=Castellaniella sp. TaxID=1955812 RepID=UPI002B001763|nr:transglycosylase SLT domain-containing protein [Castellaniella sp.]